MLPSMGHKDPVMTEQQQQSINQLISQRLVCQFIKVEKLSGGRQAP